MAQVEFNCIIILDAVPQGELNTARKLKENLEDLNLQLDNPLEIDYIRIEGVNDIILGIENLVEKIKLRGMKPLLHLEGHGLPGQNGFYTAEYEECTWSVFKALVTPVNFHSGFNLMLVLATCYGGSFTLALRTTEQAAVSGLIGPVKEIMAGEVEDGFINFYRILLETSSFRTALDELNKSTPRVDYFWTSAEEFFYAVWASYKENSCTNREIYLRASKIYRATKASNLQNQPSVGEIKRMLCNPVFEKDIFEMYRNTYFMYETISLNRERFLVTYEQAEEYIKTNRVDKKF